MADAFYLSDVAFAIREGRDVREVACSLRADRQSEQRRFDVLELVEAWDVARFVAQLADNLTNGNLGAIHQHCPNRRAQRADSLEQADTRFTIDARVDHHQVEILETALTDRAFRVDGRTHIDALLFSEVRCHSTVTGVEIDDEQPDGRIHRGPEVARTRPARDCAAGRARPKELPASAGSFLTDSVTRIQY
jgi:hypothetical protein